MWANTFLFPYSLPTGYNSKLRLSPCWVRIGLYTPAIGGAILIGYGITKGGTERRIARLLLTEGKGTCIIFDNFRVLCLFFHNTFFKFMYSHQHNISIVHTLIKSTNLTASTELPAAEKYLWKRCTFQSSRTSAPSPPTSLSPGINTCCYMERFFWVVLYCLLTST